MRLIDKYSTTHLSRLVFAVFVLLEVLALGINYALADSSGGGGGGGGGGGAVTSVDGGLATLGVTTDGVWSGTGNSTVTQTDRAIYNAIIAPITPCTTSACASANPVGNILSNTASATVTITIASPGVVTWTNHGLIAGQPVVFATTGALPTGLSPGVPYYVISTGLTASAFELSATVGGAAINTSGTQSGVQTAMAYQVGPLAQALATNAANSPITLNTGAPNPFMADLAGNLRVGNGSWLSSPNGGVNVTNVSHANGTIVGTRGGSVTQPLQFLRTVDSGELDFVEIAATQVWAIGLKCYVFTVFPGSTTFTEASAPAIAAADVPKIIGSFNMSPPDSGLGTMTMWTAGGPPGSEKALKIPLYNVTAFYMICIMTSGAAFTPTANTFTVVTAGRV